MIKKTAASRPGTARGARGTLSNRAKLGFRSDRAAKTNRPRSAADSSLWRLSSLSDHQLIAYGRSNCLDQIAHGSLYTSASSIQDSLPFHPESYVSNTIKNIQYYLLNIFYYLIYYY